MRKLLQHFLCGAVLVTTFNSFATDCVNCGPKDVSGMPKNSAFDTMEKIANSGLSEKDRIFLIQGYCMKFSQIPQEMVGSTIKEMEKTPIPPEEFLTAQLCQPSLYSSSVKSPMIHAVADDITKREEFLQNIWLYYSKKRKQPEIFDQAINAKNSKGETLLDYLETAKGTYTFDTQKAAYTKIVALLCSRGGVYAVNKNKKCP